MSKYKSKDGIELSLSGDNSTNKLIKEVVTEAIKMGASKLVIGRVITQSEDPAYMFKSFCDKIDV